jgi:hypothetical protein
MMVGPGSIEGLGLLLSPGGPAWLCLDGPATSPLPSGRLRRGFMPVVASSSDGPASFCLDGPASFCADGLASWS